MKYQSFDYTTQYAIVLGDYIIQQRMLRYNKPIYYWDLIKLLFVANVLCLKVTDKLLFSNKILKDYLVPNIDYVNAHFRITGNYPLEDITGSLSVKTVNKETDELIFVDKIQAIGEAVLSNSFVKKLLDLVIYVSVNTDPFNYYSGLKREYQQDFYSENELKFFKLYSKFEKLIPILKHQYTNGKGDFPMQTLCQHAPQLDLIPKALELASKVHKHQKRSFANEPYINHCIRVSNTPEVVKEGVLAICVAILHDCIEDADYPEEIRERIKKDFPHEVYEACDLLTHDRLQYTYEEYIDKILNSADPLAIVVKYADSLDNSIPTSNMPEDWIDRCKKYRKNAQRYLRVYRNL